MNTIRILQKTYEMLYVLSKPLGDFIEKEMPKGELKSCQDFLKDKTKNQIKDWKYYFDLDLYYLLRILNLKWDVLARTSKTDFFTKDNKRRFLSYRCNDSIMYIRNEISHPEQIEYSIDLYDTWEKSIKEAAKSLGCSLPELLNDFHYQEKQKLLSHIEKNVINPALASTTLDARTKKRVKETKDRLEIQETAEGIIAFFEDALRASGGIEIKDILHKNNLTAFEDIAKDIFKMYYGKNYLK